MSHKPLNETVQQQLGSHKEIPGQSYVSDNGIRVTTIGGQTMLNSDDIHAALAAEAAKLPKETRPQVQAAQDARAVIHELLKGIGGEMEEFRSDTKAYLHDIRTVRMSVVSETSAMTGPLREVRQFFLGSDYDAEIKRLREFVDLCERLNKLKESGFLDSVADTMLKLAERPANEIPQVH
jgi:hypothetical protein